MTWATTTELYHHGIKGQRWGIRRYQNQDGSLTSAGKKRYQKETERAERHERKKQEAIASGNARKINKYRSELSEEEVNEAISRINLMTRMDQAKEAQAKVGTDKLNRITNTVKQTANNIVDVYDTGAAVANATGLLEKELPVIFKDQKRKGVTLFDRGREQRVQRGTATDAEEQSYINDRSRRLERGTLSDEERENYRRTIEDRQAHSVASERERADLERMNEQTRQRRRSILTPRPEDYSQEEADRRNRSAATTVANADRLRRLANAATEVYGANDSRTQELRSAQEAMTNLSAIASERAARYNAANPDVRNNMRSKARRVLDRAVSQDAVYTRARTDDARRTRDAELARRAREVDEAYSAVRNIDMDRINSTFSSLDTLSNEITGSMSWRSERDRLRNIERERRGIAHMDDSFELYHHGIKCQHWDTANVSMGAVAAYKVLKYLY